MECSNTRTNKETQNQTTIESPQRPANQPEPHSDQPVDVLLKETFAEEHDRLVSRARQFGSPEADPEDVVQDAYLKLLKRYRDTGEVPEHVGLLLHGTKWAALDKLSAHTRRRQALGYPCELSNCQLASQTASPYRAACANEILSLVRAPLTERQFVALVGIEYYGLTSEEVAELYGVSDSRIRHEKADAREVLRQNNTPLHDYK